ncbi:MAG: Uma2 family endonuclease [Gemmataceae bacterium]
MASQIALVIEELAPGAKVTPTVLRMLQYLKGGVPLVWLVDNRDRCVIVYRQGYDSELFREGEEIMAHHAFAGSPARVSELLAPFGNESETEPKAGRQTDDE